MPSVSKNQQRYFFAVKNCKKRNICPSKQIQNTADNMTDDQIDDFLTLKKKSFKEWLEKREKF